MQDGASWGEVRQEFGAYDPLPDERIVGHAVYLWRVAPDVVDSDFEQVAKLPNAIPRSVADGGAGDTYIEADLHRLEGASESASMDMTELRAAVAALKVEMAKIKHWNEH